MSIFKRLFKIGQAEAHSSIDKLEDPIKLTEQGLRDMKAELDKSLQGLAELKAMAIRARKDIEANRDKARGYEEKAMMLIEKGEGGSLGSEEADRLATEALMKKQESERRAAEAGQEKAKFEQSVEQMQHNIRTLKNNIGKWENELKTLKARVKVSSATKKLNKQMAQLDSSDTVSMLERMREKVDHQEALAESYGEIADETRSVDQEIDKALEDVNRDKAADQLKSLKEKMARKKESGE